MSTQTSDAPPADIPRNVGPAILKRRRDRSKLASRLVQLGFVLALFGMWYAATTYGRISPILLPNPLRVKDELVDVLWSLEFVPDLRITLLELAIAFALSSIIGITLGYLISRSRYSIRVFEPLLAGIYSVPLILFLPLYILFFGLGPASKIALGFSTSFFPIILNTIAGFGYVDRIFVSSARSMGASDYQLFRWVLLPAALPIILTGLRIGFTVALLSILGSETIASLSGLGHRIVNLAEGMDMARMFAYIAFAVAIALFLNTVTSSLEARAKRR
jgi:ABC-type nitrate/sulfonate/bicarbonate transport system permease component